MLRIVHASDFHLDSPFASLGDDQAAQRRREQRAALDSLADLAADADLLLLSGDLFDGERAYGETLEAMAAFLGRVQARVFIAPGNHDYDAPKGAYHRMALPENVHVFSSPQPEAVPLPELGCTVWGAAFTGPRMGPPLRGFTAPADGSLQLMVLHGDVGTPDSPYGPITQADIAASGLDYLALGHVHAYSGVQKAGRTSWAYPGCLLGRGFDETGPKGALCGTVGPSDCALRFTPLPGRRYERLQVDVTGAESLEAAVRAALPEDAAEHIFRVILQGQWADKPRLDALAAALGPACWQLELRDETKLLTSVWQATGEDTLRGSFLRQLKTRYDAADEAEREKLVLAARFGLAALSYREEL